MENKKIAEIIEFTDAACPWCYGAEPVLRELEVRFRDQIAISFIMGGLVEDIRKVSDDFDDPHADLIKSNKSLARHWVMASKVHGMPVNGKIFIQYSHDYPSSFAQGIAFKAAQFQGDGLANSFLRLVRLATALEGRQTTRKDILVELASEAGLNIVEFFHHLDNGDAKKGFEADLAQIEKYHIETLPSFLVRYDGQETVLHGIQTFDSLKDAIIGISKGIITDKPASKSKEAVMDFIASNNHVAPIEIKTAFDLTEEGYEAIIKALKEEKSIEEIMIGNGSLLRLFQHTETCSDNCC